MTDFLSAAYWNKRYADEQTTWDLGEISPPLKSYIDQIKSKQLKILIPGCGNSYEAAYLLENGFTDVTVIDIAEAPANKLKQQFIGNKHIRILQEDFFSHTGKYDLILEQTFFCALYPSLRKNYVEQMHNLLSDKGKLVGVLFNTEFEKPGPPFGGQPDAYKKLFVPYFELKIFEDCYNSIQPRMGNELFICLMKK